MSYNPDALARQAVGHGRSDLVAAPIKRRAVYVGNVDEDGRSHAMWLEIEYGSRLNPTKPPELSISGVLGPKRNGDAWGGCGQNRDDLAAVTVYAPGFDAETVRRLGEVWERWHLNGTRAGCEHQRAEEWDKRPIDPEKPTTAYGKHFPEQRQDSWNMLAWVRPDEHPDGLLTAPCPTCGYRYGSAWLHEDVPDDVIEFLRALPEPDRDYPWSVTR